MRIVLFISIILLSHCQLSGDYLLDDFLLDITGELDPASMANFGTSETYFIPCNHTLLIHLKWPSRQKLPDDYMFRLQAIDSRETVWLDQRFFPEIDLDGDDCHTWRLLKIPPLPNSLKLTFRVGIINIDSGKMGRIGSESKKQKWLTLFTAYAMMNRVQLTKGWYPPEDSTTKEMLQWNNGTGTIEYEAPPFPVFFYCKGGVDLKCIPDHQWQLTLERDSHILREQAITLPTFSFYELLRYDKLQDEVNPLPDTSPLPFPFGHEKLILQSDNVFTPHRCSNIMDERILGFSVSEIGLKEFITTKGTFGEADSQGVHWISPVTEFVFPTPESDSALYIQGRRDIECIPGPQSIEILVNNKKIYEGNHRDESICIRIPLSRDQYSDSDETKMTLIVTPLFFKAQCHDTSDNSPYGIGISAIYFR